MNGLFSDFVNNLSSEDIKVEAQKASAFFCRKRKLSLPQLITTLMGCTRAGVQIEIDRLFQYLCAGKKVITYSRSAFCQARRKLNAGVFDYLRDKQLAYFHKHGVVYKRWHGYRIIAVDGSTLNLPANQELADHFGSFSNQFELCPAAQVSVAYDVCNKLTLDASIAPYSKGEKEMAVKHIDKLATADSVFIFDRGYMCVFLIKHLVDQGTKFCFRVSSSWKDIYRQLENASDIGYCLKKGYSYCFKEVSYKLDKDLDGLRIVKIPVSSTEEEILLTNLNDPSLTTLADLKELYEMRWAVEETYKRLKQVCQVEFFTGKSVEAIHQDFLARVLLLNFAAIIETQQLQPEIDKNKSISKYPLQPNRTQLYAKLKDNLFAIMLGSNLADQLERLMIYTLNCYDIVRKNRTFKRNLINKRRKRKALLYKPI